MSVMLATTNPEAMAEIDPAKDRRAPFVGQWVLFHTRPGEGRGGLMVTPALVMHVHDEDHADLLITWGQEDEIERRKIPRKTEQNNINCWSFCVTAEDERFADLADQYRELCERVEALEQRRGPGRPPKMID